MPVVSTAFRPIDADELARNPFRVFTSMLVVDDPRYFDADTRAGLQAFLADRVLFPPELLALADRAAAEGGLPERDAEALLCRATAAFALSSIPVDRAWYDHLEPSRRSPRTSAGCRRRTSTTSRRACSTSTSCRRGCGRAASR